VALLINLDLRPASYFCLLSRLSNGCHEIDVMLSPTERPGMGLFINARERVTSNSWRCHGAVHPGETLGGYLIVNKSAGACHKFLGGLRIGEWTLYYNPNQGAHPSFLSNRREIEESGKEGF